MARFRPVFIMTGTMVPARLIFMINQIIKLDRKGVATIKASPENTSLWNYGVKGSTDLKSWHAREADDRFFKLIVTPRE